MTLKLYTMKLSSPSRAVVMCAKTLGIELEMIEVNLLAGENMTPEYLKLNPQHTIPVLQDGDLVVTESRAALQYLADVYGKDQSFYPKDSKKRAMVDQRLFFDAASLYSAFTNAYYIIFKEKKRPESANIDKLDVVLGFLEEFLSKSTFAAGDNLTIADFSIVATLTTAEVGAGHNLSNFPRINAYLANCKNLIEDYEEINGKGVMEFSNFINTMLKDISD